MTTPSEFTAATAADPSTPPAVLADIATHRPDLRATVAANPVAYPELLGWLRAQGDPAVAAAIDARSAQQRPAAGPPAPPAPPAPPVPDWQPAPEAQQGRDAQHTQPLWQKGEPGQPGQPDQTQQLWQASPAQQGQQPQQGYPAQSAWQQQAGQPQTGAQQTGQHAAGYPAGHQAQGYGQQPSQDAAWGQQPPQGDTWGQPPAGTSPKKSRKGLWIGVGAGVLVLLGAGAFAANHFWFSKVGGAATPEEAATQMIEGIASKDLVSVYGVTSPTEISQLTTAADLFDARMPDGDDVGDLTDAYKDYLDALDLTLDDLEVSSEDLGDGLAKVSITSGSLTVDADADKLADATIDLFDEIEGSSLWATLQEQGAEIPSDDEIRSSIDEAIADTLPATVTADDLTLDPADLGGDLGLDLGDDPISPFLVVVEEGGDWYVSPYLTLAEYSTLAAGVERGEMPGDDLAGAFDSPEAAGEGLVVGIKDYLETGTTTELAKALPLADRRALTLYGDLSSIDDQFFQDFQEELKDADVDATFSVRDEKDGVAWLKLESLEVSGSVEGTDFSVTLDAECIEAEADGETVEGCVDQVPLLEELGVTDLSLVAVEEDGSWYMSGAATWGDSSGLILSNVLRLKDEGKLDDPQWLEDSLGDLADMF